MAEDVVDRIVKSRGLSDKAGPCVTPEIRLRGGVGYSRNLPIQLVQQFGVTEAVAEHLARTYGTHACDVMKTKSAKIRGGALLLSGYPYLEEEVEYACRHEMATSLTDMLTLRTRLAFLDSNAAAAIAPRVATLMANALGWSRKQKKQELSSALEVIESFGGPVPKGLNKVSPQSAEEVFRSFDINNTGTIAFDELKLCMKHFGAPFKSEEEALATFQKIDRNADGKIDFEEFMRWKENWTGTEAGSLSDIYRISSDKLGSGSDSRGAAFG